MLNCPNCNTKLLKDARFCHSCGTEIVAQIIACSNCSVKNPTSAKFCKACGHQLGTTKQESKKQKTKKEKKSKTPAYVPIFPISFIGSQTIDSQLKTHFFQALKNRVNIQSKEENYSQYLELFYSSGYNYFFDQQCHVLTDVVSSLKTMDSERAAIKIDQILDQAFETLLDRFTIEHTRHLNEIQLQNAILRYESVKLEDIDLEQMLFDFLDLEKEEKKEKCYTDFPNLPEYKIRNAHKSFLFASMQEKLLLLCDQSLFGSCKEGFAFTSEGLYWKAHFYKPQKAYYSELFDIRRDEEWLTINGKYFHISPSLNFKIEKFLKKLKSIL